MKANELADNLLKNGGNCSWFKEIAAMLRSQQAEIEALKFFYEDRLEAGKKREETLLKIIEGLLRKAQEK